MHKVETEPNFAIKARATELRRDEKKTIHDIAKHFRIRWSTAAELLAPEDRATQSIVTDDMQAAMILMRLSGKSRALIGFRLGFGGTTIGKYLGANDITQERPPRRILEPEKENLMSEALKRKMPDQEAANFAGVTTEIFREYRRTMMTPEKYLELAKELRVH